MLLVVLCSHQCTGAREECAFTFSVRSECSMFVMYCMQCCMSVSAVVCGCGVSRRYIDVCYCDMFSVINVYLDHLKVLCCVY